MAKSGITSFQATLQTSVTPDDAQWSYRISNLPSAAKLKENSLIKSVVVHSDSSKQYINLRLHKHSSNRGVDEAVLDRFMTISFADFRLQYPSTDGIVEEHSKTQATTPRESAEYVVRLLRSGIVLNGTRYLFYGHSNSQLKSRTCFLFAGTHEEISRRIEGLGDLTKLKSVAKKAKRIGLLFSSAKLATQLPPDRYEDIEDVQKDDYIFTDGCGLISTHFAKVLVQRINIIFRNQRYTPSVYQIRYRGYKGVLEIDPNLRGKTLVQFRDSMKKVSGGPDLSFCVVEYSKPYNFGFLNDEIILLLHALGITSSILLKKQLWHFDFLTAASENPRTAFQFLSYINEPRLAEKVLMDGLESVKVSVRKYVTAELNKMVNKRDEQRCKILILKSRLLFGVCDPRNVLKEGECALRVTAMEDGVAKTIVGTEVLVTRNPCLHPGDLQKFKVVLCEELSHLVDCIVFPTRGRRPSADLMSGGDLDGDKFFVCWDRDLIPAKVAQAASYKGAPEPVTFKKITDDDRLVYFAQYTNASLGRVKNLYLDWARLQGPMSAQCQELNYLFSHCVDGNRIRVPPRLESPPKPDQSTPEFILDTLHKAAEAMSPPTSIQAARFNDLSDEGMSLLLSKDKVAFSEFELLRMTSNWCLRNGALLESYLDFFDFDRMSDEQRAWAVAQVPPSDEGASLVMNSMTRSNILTYEELQHFKLDVAGMRWKRLFDSTVDRMGRFMDAATMALELFHRKIIVLQLSNRLSMAMYIPTKIEMYQEVVVNDALRLFSFPHSQGHQTAYRRALPTKVNYRLYFDNAGFQLYEQQRANTWIFFRKPGSDDAPYRTVEDKGDQRRARQATVQSGLNSDFVTSVALGKFSSGLARHIGRVNRDPVLGAEIYVISNRDVRSLQVIDKWLEFIDTAETMPIFENVERDFRVPSISGVDWTKVSDQIRFIARDARFESFQDMENDQVVIEVLEWLRIHEQKAMLRRAVEYLLDSLVSNDTRLHPSILTILIDFTRKVPYLVLKLASLSPWNLLPGPMKTILNDRAVDLLKILTLAANDVQSMIVEPFQRILSQVSYMSLESFGGLVETIALVVRPLDTALDLLVGCLEQESSRILVDRPTVVGYFVKHCISIAVGHIEERMESGAMRDDFLDLKLDQTTGLLKAHPRIDSHSSVRLSTNDHLRLTATSTPVNGLDTKRYSMDALVRKVEPGMINMRSLHPIPPFLEDCSWQVINCGSFVTTKTMFEALQHFIVYPEQSCPLSERMMGLSPVTATDPGTSPPSLEMKELNESQRAAVAAAMGNPLTCLWGPPGTGKTHTIAVILELLSADQERRILVTAPTHNAVDNVMRKYLANRKLQGSGGNSALRVSTDVRKVALDLRQYTCDAMMGKDLNENPAGRRKAQKQIKTCRIIFTTCIGAGLGLLRSESFDTVIIDEASQQTEPLSLVPLTKGCTKAILVGDHVQLTATVTPHARALEFDISLFERLYTSRDYENKVSKVMLDTQYRMEASICAFSSAEFYEDRLKTAVEDSDRPLKPSSFPWPAPLEGQLSRIFFIQCNATEDIGRKSKSNEGQAALARSLCQKLLPKAEDKASDVEVAAPSIAILAPYTRQVEKLKAVLMSGVTVNSIDGFQGREADVVVFVTTRCNANGDIGFLKDMRRLNVVLTRARTACIIIGDQSTLSNGNPDEAATGVWKRLLQASTVLTLE